MRVVFMGTPQVAVPTLEALAAAGHEVLAVLTQPDRPRGRGQSVAGSPVKQAAERLGLRVLQPERVRRPEVVAQLAEMKADVMVVVGYGQIIPQTIIDLPPHGILNVHFSLLPKYRGAAPLQWAVVNGETETGVTIMQIDAGLDTGPLLAAASVPLGENETAVELGERLSVLGAELLVETLARLQAGTVKPVAQEESQATLARILTKEDGLLAWQEPAPQVHNRVRGLLPWPGGYTRFRGQLLHVWRSQVSSEPARVPPGCLQADKRRLLVACGGGTVLELLEVQLEGKKRMSGDAFRNGQRMSEMDQLGEQQS